MLAAEKPGALDLVTMGEIKKTIEESTNPEFQEQALSLLQKISDGLDELRKALADKK